MLESRKYLNICLLKKSYLKYFPYKKFSIYIYGKYLQFIGKSEDRAKQITNFIPHLCPFLSIHTIWSCFSTAVRKCATQYTNSSHFSATEKAMNKYHIFGWDQTKKMQEWLPLTSYVQSAHATYWKSRITKMLNLKNIEYQ